jgi:hypothetical protein
MPRTSFDLSGLSVGDCFTGCKRCFWQENDKVAMVQQCPDCGSWEIRWFRVEPQDKGLPPPPQPQLPQNWVSLQWPRVMKSNPICFHDLARQHS